MQPVNTSDYNIHQASREDTSSTTTSTQIPNSTIVISKPDYVITKPNSLNQSSSSPTLNEMTELNPEDESKFYEAMRKPKLL